MKTELNHIQEERDRMLAYIEELEGVTLQMIQILKHTESNSLIAHILSHPISRKIYQEWVEDENYRRWIGDVKLAEAKEELKGKL